MTINKQELLTELYPKVERMVNWFCRKHKITGEFAKDDMLGVAALAAAEAMETYDEEATASPGTWALLNARWALFGEVAESQKAAEEIHMDEPLGEGDDDVLDWHDLLVSNSPGPEERYRMEQVHQQVREDITGLTPEERTVIIMLYGFDNSDFHTQTEVATALNVSQPTVARIHKTAVRKLRRRVNPDVL